MKRAWLVALLTIATSVPLLLAAPAKDDDEATETASATANGVLRKKIAIAAINDDWTRTGVLVEPKDLVVILAQGKARIRSWGDEAGPAGLDNGAGRLESKVGAASPNEVGTNAAFVVTDRGILKLRIHDSRYDDNLGGFQADILVFAPRALPEAKDVPVEKQ
jgi:hypothetical protein